jgi:hypothetical protein
MVQKMDPERFDMLANMAQYNTTRRVSLYQHMAQLTLPSNESQVN